MVEQNWQGRDLFFIVVEQNWHGYNISLYIMGTFALFSDNDSFLLSESLFILLTFKQLYSFWKFETRIFYTIWNVRFLLVNLFQTAASLNLEKDKGWKDSNVGRFLYERKLYYFWAASFSPMFIIFVY